MMRRVNISSIEDEKNLQIHLARYSFCLSHLDHSLKVLDLGCGTGYGSAYLAKHISQVHAYDIDEDQLRNASLKYSDIQNILFLDELPTVDNQYDAVISLEVIEHMSLDSAQQYLINIKNLLKSDGIFFCSTPRALPFDQRSKNRQIHHVHEYDFLEFKNILRDVFKHVFLFSQNDAIISCQNPAMAWNFIAICTN